MIDIKIIKHDLSKKLDMSAEDIDDGLIPILHSIDLAMERNETKTASSLLKFDSLIKKISDKNNKTIVLNTPKSALYFGLGISGPIMIVIAIISSIILYKKNDVIASENEIKQLKKLAKVLKINKKNDFFIENKNIQIIKSGIIIKSSSYDRKN